MNWFTRNITTGLSSAQKKFLVEYNGGCEHVLANPDCTAEVVYENDSFGKEGFCMCEECITEQKQKEDNETCKCPDCKEIVLKKDTSEWRWYDFYAAQGDEAMRICKGCWTKPKHVDRMERDDYDRAEEFGR